MGRKSTRFTLQGVPLEPDVAQQGHAAARQQIEAHVMAFTTTYQGDIWQLAEACYLQGLMDAVTLQQQYPGWPEHHTNDRKGQS
jgi:hypothetical protein